MGSREARELAETLAGQEPRFEGRRAGRKGKVEEKGVGRGRSGRAWGLEARESRGAGPARRGKSQGPEEVGLREGFAGEGRGGHGG